MNPILYAPTAESFDTNGIGILGNALSCLVTEELNGEFYMEMVYPIDGIHFQEIVSRSIILTRTNPVSETQPFRVYRITKPMNGRVKIYAQHIRQDLEGIPVRPFSASSVTAALNALSTMAVVESPFSFETDKSTAATMTVSVPSSIRSLLFGQQGGVLDVYTGEYEFDRYKVKLWNNRGADRGVSIRYGKNLTDLNQEENCANVYTGVYPYWASMEGELLELPERIVNAEGTYNFTKIKPLDLSMEYQEQPTVEQLRSRAEKYMKDNDIGVPTVSLTVSFIQLEQTAEYHGTALLERVLLGDTVSVEFPDMGVSARAKVTKTVYNSLLERYESVDIGQARSSILKTMESQNQAIKQVAGMIPTKTVITQEIAQKLSEAMGKNGGSVRVIDTNGDGEPDELYIADNPDPEIALKVWRFNYAGWAVSKTGYNGPFIMGATIEDGLLADFVTAAHLVTGTISSKDGSFFMDLDNGIIQMSIIDESVSALESAIEENYDFIQEEKSRAEAAESGLSGEISEVSRGLTLKVSKGDISSQLSIEPGDVTIGSNRLTIDSENFKVNKSGKVTASGSLSASGMDETDTIITEVSGGQIQFVRNKTVKGIISSEEPAPTDPSTGEILGGENIFSSGKCLSVNGNGQGISLRRIYIDDGIYILDATAIHMLSGTKFHQAIEVENVIRITDEATGSGYERTDVGMQVELGTGRLSVNHGIRTDGDFICLGAKNRAVTSKNYGTVAMNAMESATAVFSDMGEVTLDDTGYGEVAIDPVFAETVDLNHAYHVFTSSGQVYSIEKYPEYFVLHGNPGACIDWLVFYRQIGYTNHRAERLALGELKEPFEMDLSIFSGEYNAPNQSELLMAEYPDTADADAYAYLENYEKELTTYE